LIEPKPRRYVGLRFSTPRLAIQATEDERLRLWLREVERILIDHIEREGPDAWLRSMTSQR